MYRKEHTLCLLLIYSSFSFCAQDTEPITVFIHGTVFPVINSLINLGNQPHGLSPIELCKNRYKKIGQALNKAFPEKNFYVFGWSGLLDFQERKRAAIALYDALKTHKGPITLIAHSHGCNVALNLAHCVEDESFQIDTLILLAGPVQAATMDLVSAPLFKEIYSFYSSADVMQIADPQKLYKETQKKGQATPFFSKRLLPSHPKVKQARILLDKRSPSHIEFIQQHFLKRLPEALDILKSQEESCIINIPFGGTASLLTASELAYIPRSSHGRIKR